jgi:hypothetical protein
MLSTRICLPLAEEMAYGIIWYDVESRTSVEDSTVKVGQRTLGRNLYMQGSRFICDGGVCDHKTSILWDEVDCLFLNAWAQTMNGVPFGQDMQVRVISTRGDKITFSQHAFTNIGDEDKSRFLSLYQFIVSQVIDRQWSKLVRDIEDGKRVSFGDFDISSSAIYRKKLFGRYDIIDLGRIAGSHFANGEFILDFIDDKRRPKQKRLGLVSEIPNIHLVNAFLSSRARQNSGR